MCLSSLQVTDACLHAFLFASVHSALPFFVQDLFFVPPCLFCCFLLAHSSLRVAFVTPCSSLVLLLASVCGPPLSPTFCHAMFCAPVRCSRVKTIAAKSAQVLKRKSMLQFKPTKATTHSRCHTRACGSMCCCRTNEECKRKRRKKERKEETAQQNQCPPKQNTTLCKAREGRQNNKEPKQTTSRIKLGCGRRGRSCSARFRWPMRGACIVDRSSTETQRAAAKHKAK